MTVYVKITVSGPGECISSEMNLLEKTLRDVGYEVEVSDEYPHPEAGFKEPNGWKKIKLVAQHLPWGG